jgi:hypothetical protein
MATFPVSESNIDFYQEHGWCISPQRVEETLLDQALAGLERHWSGHRDHVLEGAGTHFVDWMPGAGQGTRNNEYISLQNDSIRGLALAPVIGAVAGALAQAKSIRLFDDQMVYKPGGETQSAVGWHVDGDYWSTCTSNKMLTAWIPLHECPQELGPLVVLDGSHKWSHLIDRSALSFHKGDMDALARYLGGLGFEFKPISLELERGQFSFHNCRTIHGSYPNRGARPRIALASHLQDGANLYQATRRPDGRPIQLFNDRICRVDQNGLPDYADPAVFPELWRAD